jgi:hypothetical protein
MAFLEDLVISDSEPGDNGSPYMTNIRCATPSIAPELYDSLLAELAHTRASPPSEFRLNSPVKIAEESPRPPPAPVGKKADGRWS